MYYIILVLLYCHVTLQDLIRFYSLDHLALLWTNFIKSWEAKLRPIANNNFFRNSFKQYGFNLKISLLNCQSIYPFNRSELGELGRPISMFKRKLFLLSENLTFGRCGQAAAISAISQYLPIFLSLPIIRTRVEWVFYCKNFKQANVGVIIRWMGLISNLCISLVQLTTILSFRSILFPMY